MHDVLVYDQAQAGSNLNIDRFPGFLISWGGGGGGVRGHGPPENFLDFNSLRSTFLGFWVIPTGYWPVPLASDEALQIEKFFIY